MVITRLRPFRETSTWKLCWDAMICVIALITGLVLPIELLRELSGRIELHHCWIVFSIIGLIDIVLSFNTAIEHNGLVLRGRQAIASRYLRQMFGLDLIANLPFLMTASLEAQIPIIGLLPVLRLGRLLYITGRWEDLQLMSSAVIRMARYTMSLMLIVNGVTCLWLWVGLTETGPLSWIQRLGLSRDDLPSLYVHSLYWTITTLATVGYGDITAKTINEMLFAVVVMIIGAVLMAVAIGNVVGIINQLDEGRREHRNRQSAMSRYLRANNIESSVVQRIRRFNEYNWSRSRGVNLKEMIAELPTELRSEVTLKILGDTIYKVPLLAVASDYLRKKLLSALSLCSYPPDTVVFEEGEIGDKILFVTSGRLAIHTNEDLGETASTYGVGDYIGDLSFFLRERRTARVVSETYVDGFVLSRDVFERLYSQEPELKTLLRKVSAQQSMRNQELLIAGVVV